MQLGAVAPKPQGWSHQEVEPLLRAFLQPAPLFWSLAFRGPTPGK